MVDKTADLLNLYDVFTLGIADSEANSRGSNG